MAAANCAPCVSQHAPRASAVGCRQSVNAGQDLQLSAGETISSASGQDTQFATGGNLRIHTGQAIGMLAGAIAPTC